MWIAPLLLLQSIPICQRTFVDTSLGFTLKNDSTTLFLLKKPKTFLRHILYYLLLFFFFCGG
jgi:hypothetical protein